MRRRSKPVATASVEPNPLRTGDDAHETGLLVGLTGVGAPWSGITIKRLKDARLGSRSDSNQPAVHARGKTRGKVAGKPPGSQDTNA